MLADRELEVGARVLVQHGTSLTKGLIRSIEGKLDLGGDGEHPVWVDGDRLALNDLARIRIAFASPLPVDAYNEYRGTGAFILVDPADGWTLGAGMAGVFGTSQPFVDQVAAAATTADELVWQLPLFKEKYRKQLDSDVADLKNVGGPYGGAINAAVFLSEFVGDVPWAHLDIAGPMKVDADESWRAKGATGFGTRLLIDLALNFTTP